MEDHIIPPAESPEEPLTRQEVERQLNALSQRLSQRLEESVREEENRREALNTREAELNQREMAARVREELDQRGLPAALADALPCATEEALLAGVNALEEAFRAAVQAGVEERLLDSAPKKGAMKPLQELPDDEYYAAVCRRD